jgi:Na+-driven multidrug efflux pump
MILAIAGFFSTGCVIVCSKLVGVGKKEEANQIFSLAAYIALVFSVILIAVCILWPKTLLHMCGVPLSKYPQFTDDMLGYLRG